jgi:hypothetical protein
MVCEVAGKRVWGAWAGDSAIVLTVAGTGLRADTVKSAGKIVAAGRTYTVANALDPWAGRKHPNSGKHVEVYLSGGVQARVGEGTAEASMPRTELG